MQDNNWMQDIVDGLSVVMTWQFLLLADAVGLVDIQDDTADQHTWLPCKSGVYSTKSAYQRYYMGRIAFEPHKRLWNPGQR